VRHDPRDLSRVFVPSPAAPPFPPGFRLLSEPLHGSSSEPSEIRTIEKILRQQSASRNR
jgi:hypothetical protein